MCVDRPTTSHVDHWYHRDKTYICKLGNDVLGQILVVEAMPRAKIIEFLLDLIVRLFISRMVFAFRSK